MPGMEEHDSQWELLDRTTNSGKLLYKCTTCGRESPAPGKRCGLMYWDPNDQDRFVCARFGRGCGSDERQCAAEHGVIRLSEYERQQTATPPSGVQRERVAELIYKAHGRVYDPAIFGRGEPIPFDGLIQRKRRPFLETADCIHALYAERIAALEAERGEALREAYVQGWEHHRDGLPFNPVRAARTPGPGGRDGE